MAKKELKLHAVVSPTETVIVSAYDEKTRTALAEYNEMKKNPGSYKRYGSFDELINEVLDDA